MRTIGFGFSLPKAWKLSSRLIKLFEGTEFSHVFILMHARPGSPLPFDKVFEASYGDVHCLTHDNFKEKNYIFHQYEFEVSDEVYYEVANWLWDQLQKPYGFIQLFEIFFKLRVTKDSNKAYICTELAGKILRDFLGYDIHKKIDYVGLNDIKSILDKFAEKE